MDNVYWRNKYGWRAGEPYVESGTSIADVVRFERDELGNDIEVPAFLLAALETVSARRAVWVCSTRRHALRYGYQPYREDAQGSIILATDHEDEKGYLLLTDPDLLSPAIVEQLITYRASLGKACFFR